MNLELVDLLSEYETAVRARAAAEAEERIAWARLNFPLDDSSKNYEVTIFHDQAADEIGVTKRCILKWIHKEGMKAEKRKGERRYRIPIKVWLNWKRNKGYA